MRKSHTYSRAIKQLKRIYQDINQTSSPQLVGFLRKFDMVHREHGGGVQNAERPHAEKNFALMPQWHWQEPAADDVPVMDNES